MELRVLRYFLAVAQEESISGAADYLHLTQPTLSRQLMDLEEELGKKLFIRGSRKVRLTEDGLLLRKRASEIVELVEKTESEFWGSKEAVAGDVYIGGGESDAMRLIARAARTLQRLHPNVHYHLFSGNAGDVCEKLDKGCLDFGILLEPVNLKRYDYVRLPCTDLWGVLMRKDSPLAALESIRAEDLLGKPLLLSRQAMGKDSLSAWFGMDYTDLDIVATYNLLYNASLMVEEGLGYAVTLDRLVNTTGDSPLCFRPLEPRLEIGLYVVWKKFQIFSKAAAKFLAALEETAGRR
ncbi:MAG: LysR family transcriptional regulator [Oscillospiraceae bacterium]|nr:LysR family transcriptional regulator [Oscillospiraceae bacterium]